MKFLTNQTGLYLHIPFCEKKCNYCDFYSSFVTEDLLNEYTVALIREIKQWGGKINRPIDTVYFGGGTPSLLSHRLEEIVKEVKDAFTVSKFAEITLEINPKGDVSRLLKYAKKAGVNRLSIGAQSGIDSELGLLGRTHTAEDTIKTVKLARKLGFSNISLDIMLGLPSSSIKTLEESLDFITDLNPQHISAYILKLEKNTAFYKKMDSLNIPDDDSVAEQYLFMCEYLENKGYRHYEISNFCLGDNKSRHNLKYWQGVDYLGIGPSAHSALGGKRFYYKRDLKGFIAGNMPVDDGECGSAEEYIMLSLRLASGISVSELENRFGISLTHEFFNRCKAFEKAELLKTDDKKISLTNKGMLLSNSIITELLECIV